MKAPTLPLAMSSRKASSFQEPRRSYNHTARVCAVGPDNKLYIQLGQPFNVPPPEKMDLYNKSGSAASSA